jgi:hypothetical protein
MTDYAELVKRLRMDEERGWTSNGGDAADAIEAQSSRIAELEAALKWQPIETVPRDEMLILTDGKRRWFSSINENEEIAELNRWMGKDWKPTHWFRVPPARAAITR